MEEQHQVYTYLETNEDFKMRELDRGDLEQFNALLQYAFQVTSYDLFQYLCQLQFQCFLL